MLEEQAAVALVDQGLAAAVVLCFLLLEPQIRAAVAAEVEDMLLMVLLMVRQVALASLLSVTVCDTFL